jgi:hypothetical protein
MCARSAGTQIGEIKKKIYRSIFLKKFEKKNRNWILKKSYGYVCPLSVDTHSKVPAEPTAHIFIVVSSLPVASLVPSSFHDTERTLRFR